MEIDIDKNVIDNIFIGHRSVVVKKVQPDYC
jgi:hypothetical protein